jgi:predicted porin
VSSGDSTVEQTVVGTKTPENAQLSVSANSLSPGQDAVIRKQMMAQPQNKTTLPGVTIDASSAGATSAGPATPGNSGYLDYSSIGGPSVGLNLTPFKNSTFNISAGADAKSGLSLGKNNDVAVMQASFTDGKWTFGALQSPMGVESYGPNNNFNDYSSIYNNVRGTALGASYSFDNGLTVGITNDGSSPGLAPNALELSYTNTDLAKNVTLNAAADLSLKDITLESNLTYKLNDRFSLSVDALQSNDQSLFSVEGSYKLGHGLSVSARSESLNGTAFAITETAKDGMFVRAQIEDGKPSFEAGLQFKV